MEIRYWRRSRGYERLDGSAKKAKSSRKNVKRVKLDPTRKRRFWRIKMVPKLRILKTASPKKLLKCLRDAYVNMMLRLANCRVIGSSYGYGEYGYGSGLASREYDEKKLVEIYKSTLMAQGNLVHRDVPKLSSDSIIVAYLRLPLSDGFSFRKSPLFRNAVDCPLADRDSGVCNPSLVHVAITLDVEYLRGEALSPPSIRLCPESVFFHFLVSEIDLESLVRSTFPQLNFKVYYFDPEIVRRLISTSVRQALEQPLNYLADLQ